MRITFVIATMGGGGAERVASILLNHWEAVGHTVSLITYGDAGGTSYELSDRIERIGLRVLRPSGGVIDALRQNVRRHIALRSAVLRTKPDVVVSFLDRVNVGTIIALTGTRIPVVISERNDPRIAPIGRGWELLRRWSYPRARALVVQTRTVLAWARAVYPDLPTFRVPNPVSALDVRRELGSTPLHVVVAAGRLVEQKGFDLLLDAFAQAVRLRSGWRLVIYGEGAERASLETRAELLGIRNVVDFPGWASELDVAFRRSGIFALSSRYEGFPNVLVEAMAYGLPVVAFACPSGPEEIVRDGIDGCLVPPGDVRAFGARLGELMDSEPLRERLGAAGTEVRERFGAARILRCWDRLLDAVVGGLERSDALDEEPS